MGRFLINIPTSHAFKPPARPQQQEQRGTTARDMYMALAIANQGVGLARNLAPSPGKVESLVGMFGGGAPAAGVAAPQQQMGPPVSAADAQLVAQEREAVAGLRRNMGSIRDFDRHPRGQEGPLMSGPEMLADAAGAMATVPGPAPQLARQLQMADLKTNEPEFSAAKARYEQELAFAQRMELPGPPPAPGPPPEQGASWQDLSPESLGLADPAAPKDRFPRMGRASATYRDGTVFGGYTKRPPETSLPLQSDMGKQMPAQRAAYQAPQQTEAVAPQQIEQPPELKTARDIAIAAKIASESGDIAGFRRALEAVKTADMSSMEAQSYSGALFGEDRAKRQRLLGALMKLKVARTGTTDYQNRTLKGRAASRALRGRQLNISEAAEARKAGMAKLKAKADEMFAGIKLRIMKANANMKDAQAELLTQKVVGDWVVKQIKNLDASIAQKYQSVRKSKWETGPEAQKRKLALKAATGPAVNIYTARRSERDRIALRKARAKLAAANKQISENKPLTREEGKAAGMDMAGRKRANVARTAQRAAGEANKAAAQKEIDEHAVIRADP